MHVYHIIIYMVTKFLNDVIIRFKKAAMKQNKLLKHFIEVPKNNTHITILFYEF